LKEDSKIYKKNDKITIMKEYVSNQTTNTFMRHGVEKYFHEYIIVVDDDWYTPCEFISEFGLEDSFGPEYVFEQVVIAVKSSIKWLKKQGFKPDEDSDDESYNLYMMIDFIKNIKELNQLNEKRIEIPNSYPVKKDEIIDLIERSTRLVHTATDDKTIQLYIYSNGSDRPEAFAEVEITSVGYILHGAEGYDYQGSSMKEFEDDLRDVVFNFDATTSKRFGENIEENTMKNKLFENILNESNAVIAQWRRDTAERLIKEANKIDPSYSFVEYDIGPKKEIKYKIFKNDDEYVGTFDVFTDEPYNSPYRFFFHHANIPNLEWNGMDIDEFDKMFKDFITTDKRLGHRIFESSLKENVSSLEWLLDKAYVSEYRMVGKNSAEVRVRHTPELLTSESMAARFDEDIPDGYRLEVDYLGEDPILGRNFDIYEVQLLKD
jgi:hypothetical protein